MQPQKLPPRTLFAIDQFVLQGGRAIVFIDPYSELLARNGARDGRQDRQISRESYPSPKNELVRRSVA